MESFSGAKPRMMVSYWESESDEEDSGEELSDWSSKRGGQLYSCGYGFFGQLGHNNQKSLYKPTLIKEISSIKFIVVACGESHSVALSGNFICFF
jgi:hypothetical protein